MWKFTLSPHAALAYQYSAELICSIEFLSKSTDCCFHTAAEWDWMIAEKCRAADSVAVNSYKMNTIW